jgi:hypothetical protein
MDKQLLKALDNLSVSLEMIAEALASKKEGTSATGAALKGGDFGKSLEAINTGIKSIKTDTQEILSNQKTIIALQKEKSKDVIEETGTDKKKESAIKKGVTTIILIAVAVLAIGLALKLVGPVDILSAIGLGLAMVAIGFAFAKVAEATKGYSLKDIVLASLAMVFMSVAVALSSYALAMIKPISITQALTAIFISGVFSVVAFGMRKLLQAFKGISFTSLVKSVIFLPLILPAIALGIALASYAFGLVKPIGLMQAISSIFIAAIFSVVAFGIRKLLGAFKGMNPKDLIQASIFLPLILPAIALGIAGASYALTLVQPVGLMQWFTSVLIAILFVVLSFGIVSIIRAMNQMKWSSVAKLPVFFVLISTAIMLSSHILSLTADISWGLIFKIAALGILMSIITLLIAPSVKAMNKMKWESVVKLPTFFVLIAIAIMLSSHILSVSAEIDYGRLLKIGLLGGLLAVLAIAMIIPIKSLSKIGIKEILKGSLAIVIIAAVIMVTSHILAVGNYEKYPGLGWIAGVGLSMLVFGAAAVALGILVFGPQALIFLAGLAAIFGVAATILGVSHILSKGKYDNAGMFEWAKATSLLYLTFTPIIFALGAMALGGAVLSFFGADDPFESAKKMLIQIADTIVAVSKRLVKGTYTGGPTEEWAKGISIALGAFMPVYRMLQMNAILSLFGGGGVGPDDFTTAILTVSDGIITAAGKFAGASAEFKNGPPEEWAKGVGLAIGAFSPVYKVLAEQDGWFSDGPSVKDMENAIISISYAIIASAKIFAENATAFSELYPSEKWGKGVGAAIGAFSPVFEMLSGKSWFTEGDEVVDGMVYGIKKISSAIVSSGRIFNGAKDVDWAIGTPSSKWAKDVAGAIKAFKPLFDYMNDGSGMFTSGGEVAGDMAYGIRVIVSAIANAGKTLSGVKDWESYPNKKWSSGVRDSVKGIIGVVDYVRYKFGGGDDAVELAGHSLDSLRWSVISSMVKTAKMLLDNSKYFKFEIDKGFVGNVSGLLHGFVDMGIQLEKKLVTMVKKVTTEKGILGGESTTTEMVKSTKDMGIVDKVAHAMVSTAKILYRGRKFFKNDIDPNFIKKLSKNIIDYTRLAEYLTKVQEKDSGMFDGIANAFGFNSDPIMKIASGMVVLAKSYDKLSTSFEKFGVALEKINMDKLKEIKSLQTDQLANDLSKIKSEPEKGVWSNIKSAFGFGDSPTVGDSKKDKSKIDVFDKGKYGKDGRTVPQQLDLLISLLTSIDQSTNTIDEFIQDASGGKITNKPPDLTK